jgi:serine/threonine-protein kinase RsbW
MAAPLPSDVGLRVSLAVEIPSDVAYIERVVELVRHPCEELAYDPHQLALNVPVALSEAISNAILRANNEDPLKRVLVRAEVDTRRLVVDVQDEGEPFDLDDNIRDATTARPTFGRAVPRIRSWPARGRACRRSGTGYRAS